jgi:hypothetical protein
MLSIRRFAGMSAVAAVLTWAVLVHAMDATMSPSPRMTDDDRATYQMIFVPTWNPATHPYEYPFSHDKQGLLTPIIGATHGDDYCLFADGKTPTPGLERLSEMGMQSPLDQEIQQAIKEGKAGSLIQLTEGSPGPVHDPVTCTFDITKRFDCVSLVGMIAPSPDWFYGVSDVRLCKNGQWVSCLAVEAFAWDAGGDGGTTYLAPDDDLAPKQPTRLAQTPHFVAGGKRVPIGVFVFTRIPSDDMKK